MIAGRESGGHEVRPIATEKIAGSGSISDTITCCCVDCEPGGERPDLDADFAAAEHLHYFRSGAVDERKIGIGGVRTFGDKPHELVGLGAYRHNVVDIAVVECDIARHGVACFCYLAVYLCLKR